MDLNSFRIENLEKNHIQRDFNIRNLDECSDGKFRDKFTLIIEEGADIYIIQKYIN